jgi:hypothetical protein
MRRLSALGISDLAIWLEPADEVSGARERGFRLLWRFGLAVEQTARIAWQARLDEDGAGRTMLAITIRAHGGDEEAAQRIALGWPIVETIARQHANGLRRAIDAYADDA